MTGDPASASTPSNGNLPEYRAEAALARELLRSRRLRENWLGAHHFADPVWDIMLDLFAAQARGEQVATSSLVIAASVPQSTALRRIRRLVRDGDVIAWADPHDGRRTFVKLSDELYARIGGLLGHWCRNAEDKQPRR